MSEAFRKDDVSISKPGRAYRARGRFRHGVAKHDLSSSQNDDRYRRLYTLMVRLAETDSLAAALDEILATAIDLIQADAGYIRRFIPSGATSPIVAHRGLNEDFIQYFGALAEPVDPEARQAVRNGERVVIEDMTTHPGFQRHLAHLLPTGHTSMIAVPLLSRGAVAVGTFCANFTTQHTPSNAEFETLELYARLAANAIEKHEYIERQAHTEQELRQAIAVKDEFLGLVSHELRTPMTVIRGMASILSRYEALPAEELHTIYEDLHKESERLFRLIENMLTVARVEAGRSPATECIVIDKVLKSCVEALQREFPTLLLRVHIKGRGMVVSGIEHHIEQVLHNLIQNASKYSPPGSPIEIKAARADNAVRISVLDRGLGLKDPVAIFRLFEREDGANQRAPGLGLGLAVCKTLVEAQGGQIWAEAREGGGSAFHFTLQSYQVEEAD